MTPARSRKRSLQHAPLDRAAIRRAANRHAGHYDGSAALQAAVRDALLERLDYTSIEPAVILDLGAATGHASAALAGRFPGARVIALDFAENMLAEARKRQAPEAAFDAVCADAQALPLAAASVDLVFSNLVLPCCDPPQAVWQEVRRVLKPGGLFNFASLGPDTLSELRFAWSQLGESARVQPFMDMHDLGDGLLAAGLAEPVLDVEYYALSYRTLRGMLGELSTSGAANAMAARPRGLLGKSKLAALGDAYEQFRDEEGRLPVTCEVVFGQVWGTGPSRGLDVETREAEVPLSAIGRRPGRPR